MDRTRIDTAGMEQPNPDQAEWEYGVDQMEMPHRKWEFYLIRMKPNRNCTTDVPKWKLVHSSEGNQSGYCAKWELIHMRILPTGICTKWKLKHMRFVPN